MTATQTAVAPTSATVTPIGAMSTAEYQERRDQLTATYGERKAEAPIRYEQELARLFAESQWTQEKLASVERERAMAHGHRGPGQSYISRMLLFGRFLEFMPIGINDEKWLFQLKESQFRGFWQETAGEPNERIRFREVYRLLEEHLRIGKPPGPKPGVGKAIIAQFADGKWHVLEHIAAEVGATNQDATSVLEQMRTKGTYKCHCERRRHGKSFSYRIVKGGGRKVDMDQLLTEVTPILQDLKAEVKKSVAVYCPQQLAILIHRFEKILETLAK